ncbi:hypothetical protein CsatA_003330 [Cannabis sativa]
MAYREPYNATAMSPPSTSPRSPWHSPVPYLFGGLAAMLGLIAFALLILACSYWKLSGYLDGDDSNNNDDNRDLEAGDGADEKSRPVTAPPVFEEKILVIMAGQVKPTFLATPVSSRSSSFGDSSSNNGSCVCGQKGDDRKSVEMTAAPVPEKNVPVTESGSSSSSSSDSVLEHQTH